MNRKDHPSSSGFRKSLISLCDKIAAACHVIAAVAVCVMLSLVVIQVVFRYLLNTPIGWTQEISVFSMMLAVMSGMAVAFWRGEHFKVSVIADKLPTIVGKIFGFVSQLITIAFLTVVVWFSYKLALRAMMQVSPTTGIPVGYVQFFLTGGCFIAAFLLTVKTVLRHDTISDENAVLAEQVS
ncbi:TRAP transporter small permease [Marinobacter litoralis]|uniref:TRAP transporter small permease n=1 Tax=Marinobacter litoralis TaxID=187981 RepID=UPI0018ED0355|nr:TRAP transporter small permease [Marinobacter litoralis]MBJ6138872.1 TRAP transporter small permease [Marinobacter litoralis]